MKILVAVQSSENPKTLGRTTLRWAARSGFNMRIFIPDDNQLGPYREALLEANHNWYLDVPPVVLVVGTSPLKFAADEGYDLVVLLPDNLNKWQPKHSHDRNVIDFAADVGAARAEFAKQPDKKVWRFENGAVMRRV